MAKIDEFLLQALNQNASDLHFLSGDPARARIHGNLQTLRDDSLTTEFVQEAVYEIMDGAAKRTFEDFDAADFAYDIPDVSRFRVNAFRHINGIGAILRAIPSKAMSLEELNMPPVIDQLCKHTQGMILVTGKTGSGKSTTLAAMIDAPPTPGVDLSPDKQWLLLLERPGNPPISEVAQPELRLAGLRINPRANGPSRVRNLNGLVFQSLENGKEVRVTGLPADSLLWGTGVGVRDGRFRSSAGGAARERRVARSALARAVRG